MKSRIPPETLEDSAWAFEQLLRNGFSDYEGDYVAILRKEVVGSGDDLNVLRSSVAQQYEVAPERIIIEYKVSDDALIL